MEKKSKVIISKDDEILEVIAGSNTKSKVIIILENDKLFIEFPD